MAWMCVLQPSAPSPICCTFSFSALPFNLLGTRGPSCQPPHSLICQGIHQLGYVHSDLKPGNLIVMQDCSVKVVDLGCAFHVDEARVVNRKNTCLGGTRVFSPPEVCVLLTHMMPEHVLPSTQVEPHTFRVLCTCGRQF